METRILRAVTYDVRFPTSMTLAGSDALNPDPDYSAAYVVLETDHPSGIEGHGLTFTIGRGTEVCVAAIQALAPHLVGEVVEDVVQDLGGLWRRLVTDTQLRWLGPEKGVIHLATAALVNALWDLYAKLEERPLWKLLAELSPEELVACVDFRYIHDAVTPDEALALLRDRAPTRAEREAELLRDGFPAYSTSAGWLGYADETLPDLARAAVAQGFGHLKLKVGGTSTPTCAGRASSARRSGRPRGCRSTRTRPGRSTRPSTRWQSCGRSSRTGSRSRRALTTSSGTGGSARPSHRSGSRPASTSRTGWCSSSSCSSERSTSARSTAAGSAG